MFFLDCDLPREQTRDLLQVKNDAQMALGVEGIYYILERNTGTGQV